MQGKTSSMSWREQLRSIARILAFVAVLAGATNVLFFARFHDFFTQDSASYIDPASNLIAGQGFTDSEGHPETVRTPGYPILIALFLLAGANLKYLVLFQHLLQMFLAVATSAATFALSGSRRQTLIVGILLSIDLPMLEAANYIMTETMFTAFLAGSLWLLWTGSTQTKKHGIQRLLVSGLLAGGTALIRPIGIFFFLPAAAYLLLVLPRRLKLRGAVAFVATFAFLPLMWGGRNYRETGFFTVSSISGWEMLCCRAAGVLAINDPGDFKTNMAKRSEQLAEKACEDLRNLYHKNCLEISFPQRSQYYMHLGLQIMKQHPMESTKVTLRGTAALLLGGAATTVAELTGIDRPVVVRLLFFYTVAALCFALVGLAFFWSKNRQLFYLAFLTIAYFVAVSSGGESYSRYRVPFIPVYVLLTATGIDFALKRLASNDPAANGNS